MVIEPCLAFTLYCVAGSTSGGVLESRTTSAETFCLASGYKLPGVTWVGRRSPVTVPGVTVTVLPYSASERLTASSSSSVQVNSAEVLRRICRSVRRCPVWASWCSMVSTEGETRSSGTLPTNCSPAALPWRSRAPMKTRPWPEK